MRRRQFLRGSCAGTGVLLAGCLGSDTGSEPTPTETPTDTPTPTETPTPEPTPEPILLDVFAPNPRTIELWTEGSGSSQEFFIELQNTGAGGDIELTFVFLNEPEQDVDSEDATVEDTRVLYFDPDERRETSWVRTPPDDYEGYGFRYGVRTYGAEIRNEGAAGNLDIELIDPETERTVEDRTEYFDEGETDRVTFSTDYEFGEEFYIETEPA